ncbi:hypothetical protein BHF71_04730 [Vulcanibacillus modesticaldus]|uniref:Metal-dependent enzyme n=1 Tax=Vulcanibacillus modesticaldus TaxID=337097 RepID=A0A1D2YRQ4_9BACI|nr:DUF1385 domain-containing protein [Vulcanibacillus modesticaldus]OEF95501.1 hypothetical protein BHF71_04730 [Vulcanibacillus modesticaldus]
MSNKNTQCYGGQAVVEGVMFGGKKYSVTAIRRKNKRIDYFEIQNKEKKSVSYLKKIPFLRGIVALIQASANGSKHLNFSTEHFDLDPDEEKNIKDENISNLTMILGVAVVGVLSFIFGKVIFTALPAFLAELFFGKLVPNQFYNNLIEGGIKIIILFIYIIAISQAALIKRLFQYHGAEHKVINAFEAGEELTVENVKKYSRFHYRCGSSFIIFSVVIGVLIYSFYNGFISEYNSIWDRIIQRIALIPVVIGVSYEVLRFTNLLRDMPILKWLGLPGIWLQYLTTKEPDESQIEVSIAAFQRLRELDNQCELS